MPERPRAVTATRRGPQPDTGDGEERVGRGGGGRGHGRCPPEAGDRDGGVRAEVATGIEPVYRASQVLATTTVAVRRRPSPLVSEAFRTAAVNRGHGRLGGSRGVGPDRIAASRRPARGAHHSASPVVDLALIRYKSTATAPRAHERPGRAVRPPASGSRERPLWPGQLRRRHHPISWPSHSPVTPANFGPTWTGSRRGNHAHRDRLAAPRLSDTEGARNRDVRSVLAKNDDPFRLERCPSATVRSHALHVIVLLRDRRHDASADPHAEGVPE